MDTKNPASPLPRRGRTLLAAAAATVVAGVFAASALAAGTAPKSTAPPTISGTAQTGQTLTAQPGTWTGTQPISYRYEWQSCDRNGANCADLQGGAAGTYPVASSLVGMTLRVKVTASNGAGSATATSAPTSLVTNPPAGALELRVGRTLIIYGGTVTLTGTVPSGQANEMVTIKAHQYPFGKTKPQPVADVATQAGGTFSIRMKPKVNTIYTAQVKATGQTSRSIEVNVRPRITVARVSRHQFVIDAQAARSLAGKYVVVQRWSARRHVWVGVRRVYLHGALAGPGVTVVARGGFSLRLGGVMTRIFMPIHETAPGYLSTSSGAFTA